MVTYKSSFKLEVPNLNTPRMLVHHSSVPEVRNRLLARERVRTQERLLFYLVRNQRNRVNNYATSSNPL